MAIKTLHITNAWHPTSGGVSTFYRALTREANQRGHQVRLLIPGERDSVETAGTHAMIYHVAAPRARFNSLYRTIYPSQYLFPGSKIQTILAAERPDLIEISDKYTLAYLGGLLRLRLLPALDFRPVIVGLSNERMDDNFRSYLGLGLLGKQFCSWYMRWIYFPFFDYHIANSLYTAEELKAASRGHLVERGTWIRHMGVDLEKFSPTYRSGEGRRRLFGLCGAAPEATLLLYVGRLAPEKNIALLFELMEYLNRNSAERKFHLIVAGDGIDRPRWERYGAAHLPGQVVFLGHIRDPKMLSLLIANADIFVHPNPHEPFGIAPLEAMASGTPLVAPNTGGVTTYAHPENAWTVAPSAANFAGAIATILANPELTLVKTQRALATAESYRWEKVAARFLDLYQELCKSFPRQPIRLHADFYSTAAKPGTAHLLRWIAQTSEMTFKAMTRLRAPRDAATDQTKSQPDPAHLETNHAPIASVSSTSSVKQL